MFASRLTSRVMTASRFARRQLSGHSAEEAKGEAYRWLYLSIGMIGLSAVVGVYNVMIHEHAHPRTDLPYMKIRNRPYPWVCSDCAIFDFPCWKECRDAMKAEKSGGDHGH